jgi:hypothetical protein
MVVQIVIGIIKIYVFRTSGFTGFDVGRIAPDTTLVELLLLCRLPPVQHFLSKYRTYV